MLLGDHRQALDQDRPEAAIVEVVGNLDGDFRALLIQLARLIQLDVGGVTDEHAGLVTGDQSATVSARGGSPVRCLADVCGPGEEPQATGFQAQSLKE
jgi:hypothetical protein